MLTYRFGRLLAAILGKRIFFQKAGTAKNRTTLRRIKGNSRITVAFSAVNGDFYFLFDAGFGGIENSIKPVSFRLFAVLAAFRRILQTFVAEEYLLANRPNKVLTAINASNIFIFNIWLFSEGSQIKFFKIGRHGNITK